MRADAGNQIQVQAPAAPVQAPAVAQTQAPRVQSRPNLKARLYSWLGVVISYCMVFSSKDLLSVHQLAGAYSST